WEASSVAFLLPEIQQMTEYTNKKIKGDIHDYKNALPTLSGWSHFIDVSTISTEACLKSVRRWNGIWSAATRRTEGRVHEERSQALLHWFKSIFWLKLGYMISNRTSDHSGSKESIGQQDTDLHPHPYLEDCRKKRKAQEWGDLISGIETKEKKKTTAPTFLLREAFFLVDSSGNISEQGRPSDQFCASIVSSWVGSFPGFNLLVRAIPTMCLQTCFRGDQIYQIWY
ncbi:hypothetical protein ACJX0J_037527, partial [Zea mays]